MTLLLRLRKPRHCSGRSLRGFTIVEMLVVIAIIGLLASVTFALMQTTRAKARDAERESEIKTLQNALAIYVTSEKIYPTTSAEGVCLGGSDSVSSALVSANALPTTPLDPLHNCGSGLPSASNHHYHYTSLLGDTYVITYFLETDSIHGKSAGVQTASP